MGSKLFRPKIHFVLACLLANTAFAALPLDQSLGEVSPAKLLRLTPEALVKEVSQRNAAIVYEQLQWQLAEREVDIKKAIFEPEFVASLMNQSIDTPNSVEEALSRSFQSQYEEDSLRWSTGVRGKVITGGEWSATYNSKRTESSVIDQFAAFDTEYRNTLQLQYKQPLLRDLGKNVTLTERYVAEFAREIAFLTYRQRMMETAGGAIQAYWDYYRAQEVLTQWQESQEIAERLYNAARARSQSGLGAQTDVLDAETAVAMNQTRVIRAQAELIEARNRIFSLMNITAEVDPDIRMVAVSKPEETRIDVPLFEDSLQKALSNWPPYLVAQQKVKSEKVQVKYSKNQLKPRLDVSLGVDMVGLDSESGESMSASVDGSAVSWYVGLEYSMPIMGNRARKNELAQSEIRERQARLELSSIRRNLSNSLHSRLARVRNAEQELIYHRRDLELKRRLRDAEIDKVQRGRSSMRELFRQEEELMEYQRRYLRAVVESKLAEASLDIAQGSLLSKYDIDLSRDEAVSAFNARQDNLLPGVAENDEPYRNTAAVKSADKGVQAAEAPAEAQTVESPSQLVEDAAPDQDLPPANESPEEDE